MVYIFTVLFRCTQFSVLNDPSNSEHIKIDGSGLVSSLVLPSFLLLMSVKAHSHGRTNCCDKDRMDVKHDAIIFLSSSLFQSTCICQTGVLFCCVSTFALKRYTPYVTNTGAFEFPCGNMKRMIFITTPSLRLAYFKWNTPHVCSLFNSSNFLTFRSHVVHFLFSWFLTEKSLQFCQKYIMC
jgi:hypothetical protein